MRLEYLEYLKIKNDVANGGTFKYRIISDSMSPIIKVDELISIEDSSLDNLSRYDIIIFWQNNKLICHFIWSQLKDSKDEVNLITKSIKNPKDIDLPVPKGNVLGKVNVDINLFWRIYIAWKNFK